MIRYWVHGSHELNWEFEYCSLYREESEQVLLIMRFTLNYFSVRKLLEERSHIMS